MKYGLLQILIILTLTCLGKPSKVIRVIDGDTFEIEGGEKVRLIGINTPEITDIFGKESKQYLVSIIEGKTVELETDNISKNVDRYQRLLRYVMLDSTDINKKMILDGFAFAYLKYRFSKLDNYKKAQLEAKEKGVGMWKNDNKEEVAKVQDETKNHVIVNYSPKAYFIGGIILLLIFIGIYSYFK